MKELSDGMVNNHHTTINNQSTINQQSSTNQQQEKITREMNNKQSTITTNTINKTKNNCTSIPDGEIMTTELMIMPITRVITMKDLGRRINKQSDAAYMNATIKSTMSLHHLLKGHERDQSLNYNNIHRHHHNHPNPTTVTTKFMITTTITVTDTCWAYLMMSHMMTTADNSGNEHHHSKR